MLSLAPPVGSRIRFGAADPGYFTNRTDLQLYESGTAALAAALRRLTRSRSAEAAEVLMPAYGCPALVAAALYAGLRPVLVDLAPQSAFPSAASLEESTTPRTAACVHVNFLGLPPPEPALQCPAATQPPSAVDHVYDCCQSWPASGVCPDWASATIVSFGRGKPITVGSGGAILLNRSLPDIAALPQHPSSRSESAFAFAFRSLLYNAVLTPTLFYWLEKVPGLHIGETRYVQLDAIRGMCDQARRHLPANIAAYEQSTGWTSERIRNAVGDGPFGHFSFLAEMCLGARNVRMLRLPLLAASKQHRDAAIEKLRHQGFGASAMYKAPLWTFEGLEFLRQFQERCPNAAGFSDRLLTLPVHDGVTVGMLLRMMSGLESV